MCLKCVNLNPLVEGKECGGVVHIVDEDHGARVTVVVWSDRPSTVTQQWKRKKKCDQDTTIQLVVSTAYKDIHTINDYEICPLIALINSFNSFVDDS